MKKAMLATTLGLIAGTGFVLDGSALGSILAPAQLRQPADASVSAPANQKPAEKKRKIDSFVLPSRQSVLAKLRPVDRGELEFTDAERLLNQKTAWQKIFDPKFEEKMRKEYSDRVAPYEQKATDPVWRPRYWEVDRYENGRKDLANWTTREVLDDQLTDFVKGGDQSSTPMKILSTAHDLSGADDDASQAQTEQQKAARAHRRDLPQQAEEQNIPTKLKTKINVLKGNGSLVFSNPVAVTSVDGNRAGDLSVNMNKEFHQLTLNSKLSYVMKDEVFNLNFNKKITDQVTLDLDHATYTGTKRGGNGEKTREQAKLNYNLSF